MKNKRKICVCVGELNIEKTMSVAGAVTGADVIEIRLDYMKGVDATPFCEKLSADLLFTCRPEWEGGFFVGDEEKRLEILHSAVLHGASYIDVELEAPATSHQYLIDSIKAHGSATQLILSNHDFNSTSSYDDLVEKIDSMRARGADIGKLITTAQSNKDVVRIFQILSYAQELDFPLIAFCMGEIGAVSRVASCDLGGYMTYCSGDGQAATAPGQISVSKMREIFASFP